MAGAVHGLNGIVAVFGGNRKHIVTKLIRMTRLFPQAKVHYLRGFNFLIAALNLLIAHKALDCLVHRPALGVPEHRTRGLFLHMVQIQLFAYLAVIALLCFRQTVDIGLKLFFIGPGGAINALQHFIVAIAAPVGTGNFG